MTGDVPKRVQAVCPHCGQTARAVRVPRRDFYRMVAHDRPDDAALYPRQTCTASPLLLPFDRIVIAQEDRP